MIYTSISVQREPDFLTLTLNRPQCRNAMSLKMVEELSHAIESVASDLSCRAIVLRGCGGHFCSGGDLNDFTAAQGQGDGALALQDTNRAFGRLITQLEHAPQFTLGLLEGSVLGGGFGLACVCDYLIATQDCQFGLPETSLGLIPAQIAPFVVKRIGLTNTRPIALLGQKLNSEQAATINLVNEVQDSPAQLTLRRDQILATLGRCAPRANATTKALLHRTLTEPQEKLLDWAAEAFAESLTGDETKEGLSAFRDKRAPQWRQ